MGLIENGRRERITPRRKFVKACLLGAASAHLGGKGFLAPLVNDAKADVTVPGGSFVINLSDFPALKTDNGSVYVQAPNLPRLIVTRLPGPKFYAVTSVCTHQGCTVGPYRASQGVLQCPCHGSQFKPDGELVRGPAPLPLASFGTKYDGVGALTIQLVAPAFEMTAALVRDASGAPRMSFTFDTLVANNYQVLFQPTASGTQWTAVQISNTLDGPANLTFYTGDGNPATVYADLNGQAGFYILSRQKLLGA